MSDRRNISVEVAELAMRAADGTLEVEQHARLESLLVSCAQAREDYADLMLTLSALDWRAGSEAHTARAADLAVGQVIMSGGIRSMRQASARRALAQQQRELAEQEAAERSRPWRPEEQVKTPQPRVIVIPKVLAYLSIAAAIALVASVIGFNVLNPSTPTSPGPLVASPDAQPRNAINTEQRGRPVRVARVLASLDARWADGRPVLPGDHIFDRPTELEVGIVEIEFTSGAVLTIEGPARITPESDMSVTLAHGKVVGRVPDTAHGFVLHTRTISVVDLGTEFAVEVDPLDGSVVHVLEGSVRLEPGQQSAVFEPVLVEQGDALRVKTAAQPTVVEPRPHDYYRHVPSPYERMIREAGPLAYWRFSERDEGDRLYDLGSLGGSIPDVSDSLMRDANIPPVCEPGDSALFLSPRSRTLLPQGVSAGLNLTQDFTIEAWVWVPKGTDRRMRIVANGEQDANGGFDRGYGFGVTIPEDDPAGSPKLMFTGYKIFDLVTIAQVPTDRWVHVAVSLDRAGNAAMYIDGRLRSTQILPNQEYRGRVGIRRSDDPVRIGDALERGQGDPFEHWVGGIDELAMYGRVLGEEEIASHARFDPDNANDRDSRNNPASGNRR